MALPLYGTVDLMEIQNDVLSAPPPQFWRNYFPSTFNSTSDVIMFDEIDVQERRLAPFVAPNVQGRMLRRRGYQTKSFKPAYLKPKHKIDWSQARTRRPGEPFLGNLTQLERYNMILADNMAVERQVIANREEQMCCSAIVNGYVDVVGEDYPSQRVNYLRDPSLNYTLSGASLWSQSTATPLTDIQTARFNCNLLGRSPVTNLIFGLNAWGAFSQSNHPDVQALLNNQRRGGNSDFNATPFVNVNGLNGNVQNAGTISGSNTTPITLWIYSDYYENSDWSTTQLLDPNLVIGVSDAYSASGVMAYGAIQDIHAGFQPVDMFPRMWIDEGDPGGTYTMTQSAPLPIPRRPNGSFTMRVL